MMMDFKVIFQPNRPHNEISIVIEHNNYSQLQTVKCFLIFLAIMIVQ